MILTNLIALIFLIILVTTLASVVKGGPYVPSDQKTIKKMLDFLQIKKGEKIADIGSGDGRIVIALAKKGALAYGYEINPLLVIWSKIKISRGGLKGKAFVYWKNFWKVDLSGFDDVSVYAINYVMSDLEKKFQKELKPGTKVVSHTFKFSSLKLSKKVKGVYLYQI